MKLYMSTVIALCNVCSERCVATTRGDDKKLRLFDRKVLRKIYRPIFNNTEQKCEIRTNVQLYQMYKREDVVKFIRGIKIG